MFSEIMVLLISVEREVLYGGSAGGGKSYAMIIDPLRNCHRPAHRALILRRSMPELREMIEPFSMDFRTQYSRAFDLYVMGYWQHAKKEFKKA